MLPGRGFGQIHQPAAYPLCGPSAGPPSAAAAAAAAAGKYTLGGTWAGQLGDWAATAKTRWAEADGQLVGELALVLDEFYDQLRAVGVSALTGEGMDALFEVRYKHLHAQAACMRVWTGRAAPALSFP